MTAFCSEKAQAPCPQINGSSHAEGVQSLFTPAFAVAAFGQTLRGDALMKDFSHADVAALARGQTDFWRQEFLWLVGVAGSMKEG